MARQIIILENLVPARGATDPLTYRYAFWLNVPVARQPFFANATATSQVTGATTAEITAIQSGAIKESVGTFSVPAGTTLPQIEAGLVSLFTAENAALASSAANQWDHYGTAYDPSTTSWTIATIA